MAIIKTGVFDSNNKEAIIVYDREKVMNPQLYTGDSIAFMQSQLATVEAKIYETVYADIIFDKLIPIDNSVQPGSTSYVYYSVDAKGMGKFMSPQANDVPQVEIDMKQHSIAVEFAALGYSYTSRELRTSAKAGIALDTQKGKSTFRIYQEHLQRCVMFGDDKYQVKGLFNHDNVTTITATVDWATATFDEILAELNTILTTVTQVSKQKFTPNTVCLPYNQFKQLGRLAGTSGQMNLFEYLKDRNIITTTTGVPLDIIGVSQLDDQGAAKKGRTVVYEKNKDYASFAVALPYTINPPTDLSSVNIIVETEYECAPGVGVKQPLSIVYYDHI